MSVVLSLQKNAPAGGNNIFFIKFMFDELKLARNMATRSKVNFHVYESKNKSPNYIKVPSLGSWLFAYS